MLDLGGWSSLLQFVFNEYGIRNMILHTENSFLSLLFIVSEKDSIRHIWQGRYGVLGCIPWSACYVHGYGIRRISLVGYGVLVKFQQPSNIFVLAPNYVPFSLSSQNTLELLHLSTLKQLMRQPQNDKKTSQRSRDDKNGKSDRKCFRCGDPNHLIGECPKPQRDKNQRAFVGSSWSDSGEEDDENIKDETFLVAQASNEICLGVDLEPDEWIKDSGCSKHMTGNQNLFSTYKAYNGGKVIFGSNLHGNIIGKSTISNSSLNIDNVEHVDSLRFNLL
ncbi:retrovirus-related pol polyprotein from transposon TNT 1-94, partial [Tanacetum coccineum]